MKTGKKVVIAVVIIILVIIGGVGYYAFQMMNSVDTTTTSNNQVKTMKINNTKTEIVVSGQVKTKESKSEYYDYSTYGKYWETKVSVGQHVNEGDIIVEAGKKDYKAPFNGYITEVNAQTAYDEAKKAYDDDKMVEAPTVLYTIVSDQYYIETELTEYEVNRLPENKIIKYAIRANDMNTYYDASIRVLSALPNTDAQAATGGTKKSDISTYQLTLNMDSGKDAARVGNHVTIRISDANTPALLIPSTAVVKEEDKFYVYVVNTGTPATVTKTEIKGAEENGKFRVDGGLETGDVIVTEDVTSLTDGMVVILPVDEQSTSPTA